MGEYLKSNETYYVHIFPPPTPASGGKSTIACQCPLLAGVGGGKIIQL